MTPNDPFERKLRAALLVAPVANDRLVLADAVLRAAIDGSLPLSAAEKAALAASPLTIRRLRQLVGERSGAWRASRGMLRAADSGAALDELVTDDGFWTLHFIKAPDACRVILQLAAAAPFARQLLAAQPMLRVLDGAGGVVLSGRLDADGECESAWPFVRAPADHFQHCGAGFAVEALP
ncbi:hypothetical protein [Massilia sp. S19_KUP03_FR1]|uniref:hypothetical protein n=1 Tax=Massilia sp. S19_KUP03_FR1 TaxID=3025503 RepID=UPI002FCDA51B